MVCVTAVLHFSTLVHSSLQFHDISIAISYGHRMSHRKQNVCLLPHFYLTSRNCHVRKCICFSHIIATFFAFQYACIMKHHKTCVIMTLQMSFVFAKQLLAVGSLINILTYQLIRLFELLVLFLQHNT